MRKTKSSVKFFAARDARAEPEGRKGPSENGSASKMSVGFLERNENIMVGYFGPLRDVGRPAHSSHVK